MRMKGEDAVGVEKEMEVEVADGREWRRTKKRRERGRRRRKGFKRGGFSPAMAKWRGEGRGERKRVKRRKRGKGKVDAIFECCEEKRRSSVYI